MASILLQMTYMLPVGAAGALLYALLYRPRKRCLRGKGLFSPPLRGLARIGRIVRKTDLKKRQKEIDKTA